MTKIIDLKSAFKLFKKEKQISFVQLQKPIIFLRSFINKGKYISYLLPKYKLYRTQDLQMYLNLGPFIFTQEREF